jgi:hypothetical protein
MDFNKIKSELQKNIYILEWDTPHINDTTIKNIKMDELNRYREQLTVLEKVYA